MNARRGFLAMVGGTLFTGAVSRVQAATTPQLVLPATTILPAPSRALLLAEESQMHAVLKIKGAMPEAVFMDWLEGGLRQANLFASRDHAAEERRIEAAVDEHGSIVAALRSGVI